jgi:carbamoyl-phosphate synthase small subunit
MTASRAAYDPSGATGVLVLADGTTIWGRGFGAEGHAVGEVCFNTAMTGYQEIMTDPSYARQIVTFTFPHIGNVGANYEDIEADNPHALGCVVRQDVTEPSSFRAAQGFVAWMRANGRIGLSGVDTRALTRLIREKGAPNGVIAYSEAGGFDLPALLAEAREWPGLEGMDLAREVTTRQTHPWSGGLWHLGTGYDPSPLPLAGGGRYPPPCRRDRLWRQAQHLPQPRGGRRARDRDAGDGDLRGGDGARSRRLLPLQRPRRSGGDG